MTFPFYKFKQGLVQCGLSEAAYESGLVEAINKLGDTEQTRKDYIWGSLNQLLVDIAKQYQHIPQTMYIKLGQVYWELRMFLVEEEKDPNPIIKLMHQCTLNGYTFGGLKMKIEVLGGNRCPQAKQIDGKKYPLEVLLKDSILPYDKCKRIGACNCVYAAIPLRDRKGNLISHKY